MFDDESWASTPGAYIVYPRYEYTRTERRDAVDFQSGEPYGKRSIAEERRAHHGTVGWNSSLKAPYQPLGTPRLDLPPRPPSPKTEDRIQLRHPARVLKSSQEGRISHIALEAGREERGTVAHGAYRFYVIFVPHMRVLTLSLTATSGEPDMFVSNSTAYPSASDAMWSRRRAAGGADALVITPDDAHAVPGAYYVAVHGTQAGKDCKFSVCASLTPMARKAPVAEAVADTCYSLILQELDRAKLRCLAARRGSWLEWDEQQRVPSAARGPRRSAEGGAADPAGSDAQQPPRQSSNPPLASERIVTRANRRLPAPSAEDLSTAAGRAQIGQVGRKLERSLASALRGSPVALAGSFAAAGSERGAGARLGRAPQPRRAPRVAEPAGKIAPARFYARALSPTGAQLRAPSAAGAAAAAGANGAPARLSAEHGSAAPAAPRSEHVPIEHRLAGHRSDYARIKRQANSKLLASLGQMERERAYNHRVRSGALAQIDPAARGLQLSHLMDLMRTDAFAIKVELEELVEARAKEQLQGRMWKSVMGQHGDTHSVRSKLASIALLKSGLSFETRLRLDQRSEAEAKQLGGPSGPFRPGRFQQVAEE